MTPPAYQQRKPPTPETISLTQAAAILHMKREEFRHTASNADYDLFRHINGSPRIDLATFIEWRKHQ